MERFSSWAFTLPHLKVNVRLLLKDVNVREISQVKGIDLLVILDEQDLFPTDLREIVDENLRRRLMRTVKRNQWAVLLVLKDLHGLKISIAEKIQLFVVDRLIRLNRSD